jgi:hypothetical protein
MKPLSEEVIADIIRRKFNKSGITVADFCDATGYLVQSVSTMMTKAERKGLVMWHAKRISQSTGARGKVWFAV